MPLPQQHSINMYMQATTGVNQTCYQSFDGTSAAAPVVSATVALTLEAK